MTRKTLIARKSNSFQFTLSLILENGLLALPAGLPGYEKRFAKNGDEEGSPDIGSCAVCTVPGLQLHLRLHDYFMGN